VFCSVKFLLTWSKLESDSAKLGFSPMTVPWKKLYGRLWSHKTSIFNRICYCKWKEFQHSLKGCGIDSDLQKHILSEPKKWKAILKGLLHVTLFLASRGLRIQGDMCQRGSNTSSNASNYGYYTSWLLAVQQDAANFPSDANTHFIDCVTTLIRMVFGRSQFYSDVGLHPFVVFSSQKVIQILNQIYWTLKNPLAYPSQHWSTFQNFLNKVTGHTRFLLLFTDTIIIIIITSNKAQSTFLYVNKMYTHGQK
jgi:hypothetical protein